MQKKLTKLSLNKETLRMLSGGPVQGQGTTTDDIRATSIDYSCTVCTLGDCGATLG